MHYRNVRKLQLNDSSGLHVEVLGTVFSVRWGSGVAASDRRAIEKAWGRCSTLSGASETHQLPAAEVNLPFTAFLSYETSRSDAGSGLLQSTTFAGLAESLTSEITLAAILEQAGKLTMLHACGIADPLTGAVVALVAKSGTGKTTAAKVLARTYTYVTDETVAITDDGAVIPYPKPLSLKQPSGGPKLQVGPDELGLNHAPASTFIKSIVLLDRVQGPSPFPPRIQKVPLADAVLALIPESSSQSSLVEPLQSMCSLIDRVDGVWKVTYTEADDLAAALAPLFTHTPRIQERVPGWAASALVPEKAEIPAEFLRRASFRDAVEVENEVLVLLESRVIRLAGIAPAIWQITSLPVSAPELVRRIGERHGLPEGHQRAIDQAIEVLIANEILVRGGF
ncbi:hypothetical protein ABIB17_002500 [Arthrobacter sp. UYEF6]